MKMTLSKYKLIGMAALLATFGATQSWAGSEKGNGGDSYSQEFVSRGYFILQHLSEYPIANVDAALLASAVVKTQVSSAQILSLDSVPKDALNFPDALKPRIQVSRTGWDRLENNPAEKDFLVFHEYLGILGVDDSDYQVSRLLDAAHICTRTAEVKQFFLDYFHIPCDRILPSDLANFKSLNLSFKTEVQLKKGDLDNLTAVTHLQMGGQVTDMEAGIFRDMSSLKLLSMGSRGCYEKTQSETYCYDHPDEFPAYGHQVKTLHAGQFFGAGSLEEIDMGGMSLTNGKVYSSLSTIEDGALAALPKLNSISFYNQKLKSLTAKTFDGLTSVQTLDLANNPIESIEPGSFANLSQLVELDLQINYSQALLPALLIPGNKSMWQGLSNLHTLALDAGSFQGQILFKGALAGLDHLRVLSLNANGVYGKTLLGVESGAWNDTPELRGLALNIKTSDAHTFEGLTSLYSLWIKTFASTDDLFDSIKQVHVIHTSNCEPYLGCEDNSNWSEARVAYIRQHDELICRWQSDRYGFCTRSGEDEIVDSSKL